MGQPYSNTSPYEVCIFCSVFLFSNVPFPTSVFFIFCLLKYRIHIVQCKFYQWLDSNCGPLMSEATTLLTDPQPILCVLFLLHPSLCLSVCPTREVMTNSTGRDMTSKLLFSARNVRDGHRKKRPQNTGLVFKSCRIVRNCRFHVSH